MSDEARIKLGETISRTRRKARLTPKQLCDETGIDLGVLVRAEFGDETSDGDLKILCRALGIPTLILGVYP